MLMNYHEMTMNEPRDSPARRKQFLVICIVMAAVTVQSLVTSGMLRPVVVEHGIFPGGELAYKFTRRDYAAAQSLVEFVASEARVPANAMVDKLYAVYLDDPNGLSGPRQRFAAGYLATDGKTRQVHKSLLAKNKHIQEATGREVDDLGAFELWPKIKYENQVLPSVNCGVVHFPFTNGFVSALILQYKIIPALRRYEAEKVVDKNPAGPVVISTCSVEQGMCTHYVPLVKREKFHLGRPTSKAYLESLEPELWVDWEEIKYKFRKYIPGGSLIF